ncbi:MAG: carboxyl-terminal processing protease [Cocleimonas sp.]|jgi:carboxyl-terminal processing protease
MSNKKSIFSGVLAGVALGLIATMSLDVFALKPNNQTLPLSQLKKFSEVYARIKNDYVEVVDDKKLMTDAISGMLKGLDPHSDYLDEDSFKELREGTSGEFGGLGIEVGQENGYIKVIAPIDDTPAKKAGVKSGDLIIRLDDKSVKNMSLNAAVKLMRGKPGEAIDLVITREGSTAPIKIKIVRAIIKVKSVKQRLLEKDYAYLRISNFQSKTTDSTRNAIKKLKEDNKSSIKGLVLDLRDNPGGVLTGAVGVSDVFLSSGNIVYTEGRVEDAVMSYDATPDDLLDGAPLVVLVNQGSASASEIVAGALQDHKRALILGTKTFGKGSVQTVLPLDETTGLKLTTARYFTPSGNSIQAKGIKPDIIVEALEFKSKDDSKDTVSPLSEADLSGHLSNPNGDKKAVDTNTDKTQDNTNQLDTADSSKKSLAEEDYQLYEALNILKSMNLVRLMNLKKG